MQSIIPAPSAGIIVFAAISGGSYTSTAKFHGSVIASVNSGAYVPTAQTGAFQGPTFHGIEEKDRFGG